MPHSTRWILRAALLGASLTQVSVAPTTRRPVAAAVPLLVTVSRYQFSPGGPYEPPIRLQAGVTYEITFRATDVVHGISSVPSLGIFSQAIVPGQDYVVLVTPTLADRGHYPFSCTQMCGSGHFDMSGAIEVEGSDESAALWLNGGRLRVELTVRTPDGAIVSGRPAPLTDDSGYFWVFEQSNVEVVVKALDGCDANGHRWVFAAGLTDLETLLRVTDTQTGEVRTYSNAAGAAFAPVQDTTAFATCP